MMHAASRNAGQPAVAGLCRWLLLTLLVMSVYPLVGCAWAARMGTDPTGKEYGKTFYIGGAGYIGNVVGVRSVPEGLRKAGYDGAIETFAWQSVLGGTLRDQIDRERNLSQAHKLAEQIRQYLDRYPNRHVNIVALSAGTGIATWALESLPSQYRVGTVVYLASSLSHRYDLTEALARVDDKLYCFYSPADRVLMYGVPFAGSVDRSNNDGLGVAGLRGFTLPNRPSQRTQQLYRRKLRNRPYHERYARYGYRGQHTDVTEARFIEKVIAPLLIRPLDSAGP